MASVGKRVGLGLIVIAMSQVSASAATQHATSTPTRHKPVHVRPAPPAPKTISDRINALGQAFDGLVGIAVKSVDDGWETGWKDHDLYPQQSVSKLWVAITALDAVDRGRISLDDNVTLTKDDLTLFHEPIAEEILKDGSYTTTLGDLMLREITQSDNTANDKLLTKVTADLLAFTPEGASVDALYSMTIFA